MASPRITDPAPGAEPAGGYADREPPGGRSAGPGWWVAALAAVALTAALVALAFAVANDESAGPEEGVTLEEVVDDTDEFVGETVTVSGRVERTVGPGFTIGEELDELVLVTPALSPGALPRISEGDVVQITGTVRDYEGVDFRELYGPTFDTGLFSEFEDQALIVATGIDPTVPLEND
jgi:hypothetical protein